MEAAFWKFSSAGNTTVFVNRALFLPGIMEVIPAEQAGFVNGTELEMAGGEMCVNACLAFAALLALENAPSEKMRIAGQEASISAKGKCPEWQCEVVFHNLGCRKEDRAGLTVQHMSGISHALVETDAPPANSEELFEKAALLRKELGLDECKAAGIVWWHRTGHDYAIYPLVSVPGAGTCCLEQACGSGSVALAASLPEGTYRILQPSGETLIVETGCEQVRIEGTVRLLARGTVWS